MKFSTAAALLFATLAVASPMPCVPDDPTSCVGIGKREPEPAPEPCVPDDPTSCVGVGKREPEPEPVPVPCVIDDPTPCATSLSVA
ncbi:hypothetical protein DBV05_g10606 [Lasiodiplodia theobromae]|uniref:Uncharacterized protein n=1 Tax=Lasiodiplodia theobromae TaxID=45133 RepID=A0A5N5CZB6_9PEZI|nr:hypothetical protein DBV05_g10606 [Lasiodiplodia theobromae]